MRIVRPVGVVAQQPRHLRLLGEIRRALARARLKAVCDRRPPSVRQGRLRNQRGAPGYVLDQGSGRVMIYRVLYARQLREQLMELPISRTRRVAFLNGI